MYTSAGVWTVKCTLSCYNQIIKSADILKLCYVNLPQRMLNINIKPIGKQWFDAMYYLFLISSMLCIKVDETVRWWVGVGQILSNLTPIGIKQNLITLDSLVYFNSSL